ncbi:hypothetical protein OA84_09275 [Kaistella solincola]|uniref:DUF4286 family protein n=1 Tax=Kaistella solincola TaxID=510955 RepID=A0ABR4ZRH8_9FLAO|nr:DUF4286 family protein [Kaistella solincola]KIA83930.1 hypothetical protein OA84_09275 [Kaistella solincola]
MSLLSVTFHSTADIQDQWSDYLTTELHQMVENLLDVKKYILSEVESDMVSEGQNTNLLLMFSDAEKRQDFVEIELTNITEIIEKKFADQVMVFVTFLNPSKTRF